jgi:PKD repeat protein
MKNLTNLYVLRQLPTFAAALIAACLFIALRASAQPALSAAAINQIEALQAEKTSRTSAQQKLDSQLIYAAKERRGLPIAAGVPLLRADVKFAPDGRVLIDINAKVTPVLTQMIEAAGGDIINNFPQFNAVRALMPLDQIESLAALANVTSIRRADEARTELITSEGDVTHRAHIARNTFGVSGAGVKIGVLSDSVDYLTNSQTLGELGPVTILPEQFGTGKGEGSAMLEIVHDLAPGSQLFYATAFNSQASFAQNILNLRAAGCDVIVDDVIYFAESPFQDGIIARAVNAVTADGALYFSAAMNSGNKNDGTSGTWEGDFVDGGPASAPVNGKGGRTHDFGGGTTYNTITPGGSIRRIDLFWADPLGASTNDYDVYLLDSTGANVLFSSTTTQNGTQDPYESIGTNNVGWRVVIVKASGDNRFLHLETGRSRLTFNTAGNTHGHSAATNAFSVAAINVATAYPGPFIGGVANPVETFSSDGPRRVFFNADGTAITPGDYSSTGGAVRQKPDIAAADGGKTSVPGFNPFFGTSAAAPHAAAIAALLKSHNKSLTPVQVRAILTTTALDTEAAGVDRDSGAGIVMAYQALQSVPPVPNIVLGMIAISGGNGNGIIESNECNLLNIVLLNGGGSTLTNLTATLMTTTPGVTIVQPVSSYSSPTPAALVTNITPFAISSSMPCGIPINFSLLLNFANGSDALSFQLPTCQSAPVVVTTNLALADAQQIGRLSRDLIGTSCGYAKSFPGVFTATGTRSYHDHSFTNLSDTPACLDLKFTTPCLGNLFVVAYLGSFDPLDITKNYLSDMGGSTTINGEVGEFVFTVPAKTNVVIVVHTVTPGTTCSSYTLTASGLISPSDGGGVCAARLVASPASRDFGILAVGATASQTFTVTNAGAITLNGTATADPPFAVTLGSSFSVPPGQATSVTVTFAPTNSGAFTGSVIFLSDGANSTNAVTGAAAFAPSADFTAIPIAGLNPVLVSFTDASSGDITNWFWDFGDGNTSSETNPSHTYTQAGIFTVTHAVTGPSGTDSLGKVGYILVTNQPPVAAFEASPLAGFAPLTVYFTNLSSGATDYGWSFGDGDSSADSNPVHTYTTSGIYTVTLNATNFGGLSILSRAGYILVNATPLILSPTVNGDDFTFTFDTIAGKTYVIEYKDSLDDTAWQTLQSVPGGGNPKSITNSITAVSQRFFRLDVQ